MKGGFFIEAGANDFETDSNTLLFELKHNWTGILVEPNPTIFPKGFSRQRKVIVYKQYNPDVGLVYILNIARERFS